MKTMVAKSRLGKVRVGRLVMNLLSRSEDELMMNSVVWLESSSLLTVTKTHVDESECHVTIISSGEPARSRILTEIKTP